MKLDQTLEFRPWPNAELLHERSEQRLASLAVRIVEIQARNRRRLGDDDKRGVRGFQICAVSRDIRCAVLAPPSSSSSLRTDHERLKQYGVRRDQYDVVLTPLDEAQRWVDAVDRAYPTLRPWRYDHYWKCQADGKIVIGKDAKRGIGRFYPLSRLPQGARNGYTRACNFPVQGSCADASMLALEAIDRLLFEHEIDGGPVAWLHDEIILEVPDADAEQARESCSKKQW